MDRRKFIGSTAMIGAALSWQSVLPAWAQSLPLSAGLPALNGSELDLDVAAVHSVIAGHKARHLRINGQFPAPLLRWREGDELALRINNLLDEETSIHWHGLLLPWQMDGVPGVSFPGIPAGDSFTYRFPLKQAGTYWYHSHSGWQEQLGHYGPIIIDPLEPEPYEYQREYVIMLSDWTFEDPARVFGKLKKMSDNYNFRQRTVGDFFRDVREQGMSAAVADRKMWGDMRMTPTDLADVTSATYTYLINGHSPAENWTALFTPGERIRLRFINASAMSIFNVRIPGLAMTVIQSDGQPVQPVETDEFQIGTAETFDVLVQPTADAAFTIMAETNDFMGYARATLAPRAGMEAAVPPLRKRPLLTMKDMGMDHGEHTGAAAPSSAADAHAVHDATAAPQPEAAAHAAHAAATAAPASSNCLPEHAALGHCTLPEPAAADPHAGHAQMSGSDAHAGHVQMSGSDAHAGHMQMSGSDAHAGHMQISAGDSHAGHTSGAAVAGAQRHDHPRGPGVASVADNPVTRLHERPLGLENEAHRVLVYTDLRSPVPNADTRAPGREVELHLTANMERYMWSFDGVKYSDVDGPIPLVLGERVRLTFVNDTMMPHPLHLHGMFFDLVNGQGAQQPRKHTLLLKPGEKASVDVTADAEGDWAFHCHLLYHMQAGMMRVFSVRSGGEPA